MSSKNIRHIIHAITVKLISLNLPVKPAFLLYNTTAACLLLAMLFQSCMPVKENPKYGFSDGIYKLRTSHIKKRVYVQVKEDSVQANYVSKNKIEPRIFEKIPLNTDAGAKTAKHTFSKASFDVDVLSIPLKFRPGTSSLPNQLTSNINGAVYVGRRIDVFSLKPKQSPLGGSSYVVEHYGFSVGFFTGLGSTAMNASVTGNASMLDYDGAVVPLGITGLFAVNNITSGIAIGVDQLLSRDRKIWIYKRKPWIGLSVGLNLN